MLYVISLAPSASPAVQVGAVALVACLSDINMFLAMLIVIIVTTSVIVVIAVTIIICNNDGYNHEQQVSVGTNFAYSRNQLSICRCRLKIVLF